MSPARYKRVILKISGELLAGEKHFGIDPQVMHAVALEVKEVHDLGVQIGIIVGGGNIVRGLEAATQGMERITGDNMGMLSTIINSIAFQDQLERLNVDTRVCSAINVDQVVEPYIRRRALRHLDKNRIVIIAAGTGNPNFTTDTAAALRSVELDADIILKGTKVDGVYDSDPVKNNNAFRFDELTYMDVVKKGLKVMDPTAITLSMDNNIPVIVFNFTKRGNLLKVIKGEKIGTIVRGKNRD